MKQKSFCSTKVLFLTLLLNFVIASYASELLQTLSLEKKIGQLFIATIILDTKANQTTILSKEYPANFSYVESLIVNQHIGGIIFLGASKIKKQTKITKELQSLSQVPLFICQNLEPGRVMH